MRKTLLAASAAVTLGSVGIGQSAHAANFVLQATDAGGQASFNNAVNFRVGNDPGGAAHAPSIGNTYQTGSFRIRTENNNATYTFAGDSLELQGTLGIRIKNTGGVTVDNLILNGGSHLELTQPFATNGAGSTGSWAGNINIPSGTATILAGNATDSPLHVFTVSATISGAGGFNTASGANLAGQTGNSVGTVILEGNNSFTGGATTNGVAGSTLRLGNANAVKNSTLTVSVAGGLTFSPTIGTFNLGGLAGTQNIALTDTAAAAVTLNVGGGINNNTASYGGSLSGDGGLTKSGTGTQTLTSANSYLGTTTVKNGTLALGSAGTISNTLVLGESAVTTGILDVTAKPSFSEANVSGNGTINIGTGKTVTVSGAMAPGFGIGTMNITGGLALGTSTAMELAGNGGVAGTDSDLINVSEGIAYAGALTVDSFGGYNLAQNASFNLFDFAGSDVGQFASVTVGGTALSFGGNVWTGGFGGTTYNFSEGTGVLTIAIPEPASLSLLGLGSLAFLRRRRV